ncbi:MAG TPA: hotdog domain-containing protein, partial [Sulfuricurvum sp.]|nr:hotdog domain-containing protein [Sulfuricurvum sp.]
ITVEGLVIGQAATVFVTDLHFKEPVKNGDIFTIYTTIDSIGRTSIRIHVDFNVRRRETNCECSVVDAIFTFVTVDEAHNKIAVLDVLRHDVEEDIREMARLGASTPRYAKK